MNVEPIDQARRYFFSGKGVPPAISGAQGHSQAYSAATALINGFALARGDAEIVFREWNLTCQPEWSESELAHKLNEAERKPHDKPRGHLLSGNQNNRQSDSHTARPDSARPYHPPQMDKSKPVVKAKQYAIVPAKLPEEIPDGCRKLLKHLFRAGEGIRITPAHLDDDCKEIPNGSGMIDVQENWLQKLDKKKGNPNGIFSSSDKTGIYLQLNPVKIGGSGHDSNVTDYRHALVEFDKIPIEDQYALILASKIPCAAITYSGGKSVHAIVKVCAKSLAEFKERVEILFDHFEFYKIDEQNKNPARLSRLPNCERFSKRQELLSLDCGCASFEEWQNNEIEPDVEGLGEEISIDEMLAFEPALDENCLLGNRWLCRGGACLFIGQSGVGKSSLAIQMAILFALNKPCFGIQPKRALKSLLIQAENDFGDVAEMFQGVMIGMDLSAEEIEQCKKMISVRRMSRHVGFNFTQAAAKLIRKYKPDLCWVDPLMAYIGDDISRQSVCSQFFREWLNPISESSGVCWMMMHHTNKPLPDKGKMTKGWTMTDFAYTGAGSAELVNWARAVCILNRVDEDSFQLMFGKRGLRAGARDFNQELSVKIMLAHSKKGICWDQIPEPTESEKAEKAKAGRKPKEFEYEEFLTTIKGENLRLADLVERAAKFSDSSAKTVRRNFLETIKSKLKFDPEYDTYSL